ncbi:MAG: hypothetical protein ND807_17495 [Vicinamibacterales bacterium]|nr:hypothetical protein [Vicinamibacterales bacterium]
MESYVVAGDHQHLSECGQCKARFDDLARALEQIREDAVREADAVFTNDRLHEQRDRILRRLERQGHPAEVLLFPGHSSPNPVVRRVLGPARRWVAGAAAAGLAAGLFLGFAMDRRASSGAASRLLQAPAAAESIARARYVADSRDEQILMEIEDALDGPRRVLELRAIDVMTTPPELQEASLDIR